MYIFCWSSEKNYLYIEKSKVEIGSKFGNEIYSFELDCLSKRLEIGLLKLMVINVSIFKAVERI